MHGEVLAEVHDLSFSITDSTFQTFFKIKMLKEPQKEHPLRAQEGDTRRPQSAQQNTDPTRGRKTSRVKYPAHPSPFPPRRPLSVISASRSLYVALRSHSIEGGIRGAGCNSPRVIKLNTRSFSANCDSHTAAGRYWLACITKRPILAPSKEPILDADDAASAQAGSAH